MMINNIYLSTFILHTFMKMSSCSYTLLTVNSHVILAMISYCTLYNVHTVRNNLQANFLEMELIVHSFAQRIFLNTDSRKTDKNHTQKIEL